MHASLTLLGPLRDGARLFAGGPRLPVPLKTAPAVKEPAKNKDGHSDSRVAT